MNITLRKIFWWVVLAIGSGASVAFAGFAIAVVAFGKEWPSHGEAFLWPAFGVPLAVVSQWRLRLCYRELPMPGSGKWQLSLADALAVMLISGTLCAIFRALMPEWFLTVGLPHSVGCGLVLPIGMMLARRKDIISWKIRYVYAVGFSIGSVGAFVTGALALALVVSTVSMRISPFKAIHEIYFSESLQLWERIFFRTSLVLVVIGPLVVAAAHLIGRTEQCHQD